MYMEIPYEKKHFQRQKNIFLRTSPGRQAGRCGRINKALHMSAGYVVFLAIAAIAALIVCTGYLKLQSEITSRSRNIASLQEELADLKEDNTTRYNAVLNSVNLEEIREKAINELGMVYASPEQIIKYKSPTSNTVKQYEDIPKSGVLAGSDKVEK